MAYSGTNTIHASFNWNPAYDTYKHVALWGNDVTGDGTKKYPYKTLAKAVAVGGNIVIGTYVLRDISTSLNPSGAIVGDGNVIFDVTAGQAMQFPSTLTNINFRGSGANLAFTQIAGGGPTLTSVVFDGAIVTGIGQFNNVTVMNLISATSLSSAAGIGWSYCTFYNNTGIITITVGAAAQLITKCIFKNTKINFTITSSSVITYCNFYGCAIKFNSTGSYVIYTDFNTFRTDFVAAGGTAANLLNLYFVDPLFNSQSIGDLSLAINSPCKNMATDGTLIGNPSIGVSLVGSTTASASAFDNSSAVNMTIDGTIGALSMTDITQNSIITTKPIANLAGRNILKLNTFGFYSDRNGEYIDSTPDVDLTGLYSAGDTLTVDRVYLVDTSGGQITYNGTNYAVGDRFVCKTGATTFSNTSVAAYAREIIEGPTRNNVEARFSNGTGTFKNNGDTLTSGYWYYLSAGTATLSSVGYTAGQFIKGDGTALSSSGATIEEVFTTDAYQYYETFGPLTCNRTGNVFTGSITKGNGDPAFDRTTANVFKIASKYIQIRYTIQANNLTP